MRRISDTIARLAAYRNESAHGSPVAKSKSRLRPLNGFGTNPGQLDGWTYVPDILEPQSPLVVILHGCKQNADGYDYHSGWTRLADEAGFVCLFPEQTRQNNPNLCFNWFSKEDVTRGSGEVASIRQMIASTVETYGLDRHRIFINGLSAGGAMSAAMLAVYPDVFAGGAVIAGLPFGCALSIPQAFDRMRGHGLPPAAELQALLRAASTHDGPWPRLSVWHGDADQTVSVSNALSIIKQWVAVHDADPDPSDAVVSGRRRRKVWSDSDGSVRVEMNVVAGMGHGTPLSSQDLGKPGPFMLECGLSSTREIACFWGIASAAPLEMADGAKVSEGRCDTTRSKPTGAVGIQKTIEDALRAAGLMR